MKGIWRTGGQALMVVLATAALAMARPTSMPAPGTLNYVEGQVRLNGQDLTAKSAGSAMVEPNQTLDTGQGNAEMLLTPGVFFRLGNNSEARMVSPGLANTSVELVQGSGMLEVTELFKENDLSVLVDGATTRIEKTGLYDFNAAQPAVSVLDGKATVYEGDAHVTLKKGREVLLASGQPFKAQKLNKEAVETDPLYRWSKLRSEYESQANIDAAQTIVVNGGWYGPGWYWDPFWDFYAFLPGDGILYSPFGWGFYSPWHVWGAPYHGHYRYPVAPGHGFRGGQVGRVAPPARMAPMSGFHGGFQGSGGFHGGFGGARR